MRFYVGITDFDWLSFLAARPGLEEANFWQPRRKIPMVTMAPGEPFLFKVKLKYGGFIAGGGVFVHFTQLPGRMVWETFGEGNGAASYEDMERKIFSIRPSSERQHMGQISCNILGSLFFLPKDKWVAAPSDWAPGVVRGKRYDTDAPIGMDLWQRTIEARAAAVLSGQIPAPATDAPSTYGGILMSGSHSGPYGQPHLVYPRLGQGGFRALVTDAYDRRCAITGERTLPALEAAHVKPYSEIHEHRVDNGLLLRRDLHALFDDGYITVTPDYKVRVSSQIREEFHNGRDYYALEGRPILLPFAAAQMPVIANLEWHGDMVFRR